MENQSPVVLGRLMSMTRIFNGCAHNVNIITDVTYVEKIRKFVGDVVISTIPKNHMLNAVVRTKVGYDIIDYGEILFDEEGLTGKSSLDVVIPTYEKEITNCDPLPSGYDIYIVSALYASAAAKMGVDTSRLWTICDPVYNPDGDRVLGCRGICPAF